MLFEAATFSLNINHTGNVFLDRVRGGLVGFQSLPQRGFYRCHIEPRRLIFFGAKLQTSMDMSYAKTRVFENPS